MSARKRGEPQAKPNAGTVAMLRSYAERVVYLEKERRTLAGDIKDVLNEAASQGFDKKALKIVVARMQEDEAAREARTETEGLADVYLASMGMLDGTPLGDAARRRFDPIADPEEADDHEDAEGGPTEAAEVGDDETDRTPRTGPPPAGAMTEETIAASREEGSQAAASGLKIFDNPYVAGDPRRAAWDEGWCVRNGSDGMEIPDAWRRRKKKKPDDAQNGAGDGAAS